MRFKHTNIHEDLDYKDHVVNNEKVYVNDFLTSFSKHILQYVGEKIIKVTPVELYDFASNTYYKDYSIPLAGEYYLFVAAKFLEGIDEYNRPTKVPHWDVIRNYSGANNCTFFSYVNLITIRHFNKIAIQDGKEPPVAPQSQDLIFSFLSRIYYDQDLPHNELNEALQTDLQDALNDLKDITPQNPDKSFRFDGEKDYRVLELCCMYNYDWDDIADELEDYFTTPFSVPLTELPEKEKKAVQTRISQWKKRAIHHLTSLICKRDKYNYLKSAILLHRINRKH